MPGGWIIVAALLLTMVFAVASGGAVVVAWWAWRDRVAAQREAREAGTRAALLETALADIRARRSAAVARGNRTRGAAQAEKRKATLMALQDAIAVKRAGGQHSLPLDGLGSDRGMGACGAAPPPTHSPKEEWALGRPDGAGAL